MAYLREEAPRDLLCIAGGSGLSPMVSIARAAAICAPLANRQIHFLYGGRGVRDLCGESLLAGLPGFGRRLHYHAALSEADPTWTGRTGFIHEAALEQFGDRLGALEIYFAGPPAMAQAMQRMLFEAKVPPEQIHFDEFY
jgi:toluene monooxygenase electron transfer component